MRQRTRIGTRIRPLLAALCVTTAGLGLGARDVAAAPVALAGDDTTLETALGSNALTAAGIALSPLGFATTNGIGEFILPITGGSVDLASFEGTIDHATSGLRFSRATAFVSFSNWTVDLTNLVVAADVDSSVFGSAMSQATVFSVAICPFYAGSDPCYERDGSVRIDDWGLRLSASAASLFGAAFGLTPGEVTALSTGPHLALAEFDLRPVPEPGTLLMVGVALAGLAIAGRRR